MSARRGDLSVTAPVGAGQLEGLRVDGDHFVHRHLRTYVQRQLLRKKRKVYYLSPDVVGGAYFHGRKEVISRSHRSTPPCRQVIKLYWDLLCAPPPPYPTPHPPPKIKTTFTAVYYYVIELYFQGISFMLRFNLTCPFFKEVPCPIVIT